MGINRKIKVLQIHTRGLFAGSGAHILLTMQGLEKAGFESILACGDDGPLSQEAQKRGLRVVIIPHLKNTINLYRDFLAFSEITAVIRKEGFDIVHTNNSKAGILGRLAARICKVPIIVHTMHSCVFRYPYFNFLKRGFFYLLEKWAAGFTDKIITITQALRKTFVESRIAPAEKFITIYSGIELEKFRVQVDERQKKPSLGIDADDLVVGIVARLAEGKGHEFVIQAVPLVIKEIPRVKFIFVGGGPLKNQLEGLVRQVGVKDKVIFTGERNDVPELLAVFDVFCLASLYEGMSRAILEAQVAGKPVVATRIGGIPDVVLEGKTAFLVEPKDSVGLAAALIRILKDENLRKEMSRSAKEFVGYQFSAQKMVEDVVKVYNELLRLEA